jgi:hypothetical protein
MLGSQKGSRLVLVKIQAHLTTITARKSAKPGVRFNVRLVVSYVRHWHRTLLPGVGEGQGEEGPGP